jgi:dTDP-4-amino-4,6-dideoxygalactose transaminase
VRVPLLDLTRQYARISEAVSREIGDVIASQHFILGPKVDRFESAACDAIGCSHAIGMSSGTDAWLAILMALGIGPGDAVITTPYTFFATAGCIHRVGAEPVFVDIDPVTFNLDPSALRRCIEETLHRDSSGALITPRGKRVRAIVPVHLFGLCCDMDPILARAREYNLTVVEDAAQAIGAEYLSRGESRQAGAIADLAYFSFFPAKNLGAFGDAGMAACRDHPMARKLRLVRNHGMEHRYFHRVVGGNFRIDALQAAILTAKLPHLPAWNAARRANAAKYALAFANAGLLGFITPPAEPFRSAGIENHHIYHQYVIRARRRDELIKHLESEGIGHGVYYPVPLHLQECFAYLGYQPGDFPISEQAARDTLALPIFPELRDDEIARVTDALAAFYR